MRWTPDRGEAIVSATGSPSGTRLTTWLIATIAISSSGRPRSRPTPTIARRPCRGEDHAATEAGRCAAPRGVSGSGAASARAAMRPDLARGPGRDDDGAGAPAVHVGPRVDHVVAIRCGASGARARRPSRPAGTRPSARPRRSGRAAPSTSRASATIASPASTSRTSPGTTSRAAISAGCPLGSPDPQRREAAQALERALRPAPPGSARSRR